MYMNKGLNSEHILLKLYESIFFITNGQLVCKMVQAQVRLIAEQNYTQKLEELIREKQNVTYGTGKSTRK